jgi:4-amino-4-deoxy-L-arabinose transferase-like glycosyltransferase
VPAHVFLSARVTNDAILPVLGAITIGLAWRYLERPSRLAALLLGLASALAVGAKFLAAGVVAAAVVCVAWEAREKKAPNVVAH